MPSIERARRAYTDVADRYIELLGSLDIVDPADRRFIQQAFAGVDAPILDAGCGPGHLTAFLASLGHAAQGVDAVPAFVDHARRAHPEVPFASGTIEHLAHDDTSLGGVLAWYSLIHMTSEEFDATLREFHRVLRPGGVLVLGLFPASEITEFDHKVTSATAWPEHEVAERLKSAGFVPLHRDSRLAEPKRRAHLAMSAERRP